jgi:hypothetical protein
LTDSRKIPAALFGATIVLSAFLLFQVQPLIAKLILPWFGGSAAVWTSCMLFFQMALLGGYAYAHWLNGQPPARQTWIHAGMLTVSFLSLPILPAVRWKPAGGADPLLGILGLLTATVGLPYFLLSSTSPLLQSWYSRANGGAMPWRFFAISNAGSMIGLLSYPILIEPYLTTRTQAWMWSLTYAAFALVCGTVALRSRGARTAAAKKAASGPTPAIGSRLLWMVLAACPSALLLAVTNHLTQNVAAIPFLWVAPLSLYLISFILCFDSDRWYNRQIFGISAAVILPISAYLISEKNVQFIGLKENVAFFCVALFVLFMVCHGELARRRPAPAFLTSFYLMVSVGGAIGGLLIGFVAPYTLHALYDLPIVISFTSILFFFLFLNGRSRSTDTSDFLDTPTDRVIILGLIGIMFGFAAWRIITSRSGAPAFLNGPRDTVVIFSVVGALALYSLLRAGRAMQNSVITVAIAGGVALGIGGFLARDSWNSVSTSRMLARNFYGALAVFDQHGGSMGPIRLFRHGTIDHGEQFLWPQYQRVAAAYFGPRSGVGRTIRNLATDGPMKVGIIGLGAGTLAAYARAGDDYRIYEINPLVEKIALSQFTFLPECPAPHQIVLGDARLSLETEPAQNFDLLIMDAFSGDAIPVHLLTREAFRIYWRHLKPDGVLAVHVSNRFLDVGPVVALQAAEDQKPALMFTYAGNEENDESASDWVIVTSRPGFFKRSEMARAGEKIIPIPGLRLWTDDYSNLYRILR